MEKVYQPHDIEKHWYQEWKSKGYFQPADSGGQPFCIMIPPPNVTGTLHMGHAFNNTVMDSLTRYHRMCGDNTLWQPGTDHAGIATQMVVERQLNAAGTSRTELGREQFLEKVAMDVNGSTDLQLGEKVISFKAPFKKVTMTDAIIEYTGFDISGKSETEIRDAARKMGLEVDESMGKGKLIDEIFGEKCEDNYIQPTFITDYPKEMSPLCKQHRDNPELTERFELIVNGNELANAYSELNDPIDQLERFEEQLRLSEKGDDEAMFIDRDFIRALEYGMPPTSGLGIGMDRLVMLLTNQESIQEVLFFPQMKPEPIAIVYSAKDFIDNGVEEEWAEHMIEAGIKSPLALKEMKATKLHQMLNGFRKKNKLTIPALQLTDVEAWIN